MHGSGFSQQIAPRSLKVAQIEQSSQVDASFGLGAYLLTGITMLAAQQLVSQGGRGAGAVLRYAECLNVGFWCSLGIWQHVQEQYGRLEAQRSLQSRRLTRSQQLYPSYGCVTFSHLISCLEHHTFNTFTADETLL
jgi:hypothetical protein